MQPKSRKFLCKGKTHIPNIMLGNRLDYMTELYSIEWSVYDNLACAFGTCQTSSEAAHMAIDALEGIFKPSIQMPFEARFTQCQKHSSAGFWYWPPWVIWNCDKHHSNIIFCVLNVILLLLSVCAQLWINASCFHEARLKLFVDVCYLCCTCTGLCATLNILLLPGHSLCRCFMKLTFKDMLVHEW